MTIPTITEKRAIAEIRKIIFMRFKVSLKKNGKEFDEVVIANNKNDFFENTFHEFFYLFDYFFIIAQFFSKV